MFSLKYLFLRFKCSASLALCYNHLPRVNKGHLFYFYQLAEDSILSANRIALTRSFRLLLLPLLMEILWKSHNFQAMQWHQATLSLWIFNLPICGLPANVLNRLYCLYGFYFKRKRRMSLAGCFDLYCTCAFLTTERWSKVIVLPKCTWFKNRVRPIFSAAWRTPS